MIIDKPLKEIGQTAILDRVVITLVFHSLNNFNKNAGQAPTLDMTKIAILNNLLIMVRQELYSHLLTTTKWAITVIMQQ